MRERITERTQLIMQSLRELWRDLQQLAHSSEIQAIFHSRSLRGMCRHREMILRVLLTLGVFLMGIYHMSAITMPILYNDEIGYWSNSYFFTGHDWSSVTGQIGYYSYGYSLLLMLLQLPAYFGEWDWRQMYNAGIVLNSLMIAASYILSLQITKRMLPQMNRYVRDVACFVIFMYPATILYEHITWSESTLNFCFWLILYVMMRVVDKPTVWNHLALGILPVYMYAVHQRSLGIVISMILFVIYRRLFRKNTMGQLCTFFAGFYVTDLIHTAVKKNLQTVNYLGGEHTDLWGVIGYAFTKKTLVFFIIGLLLIGALYLIEKGRARLVMISCCVTLFVLIGYLLMNGMPALGTVETNRLAVNEFAGQLGILQRIFTRNGMIRLGISLVGKWFYLAGATGFLICWSMAAMLLLAFVLAFDGCKRIVGILVGRAFSYRKFQDFDRLSWLLGFTLAWFSSFMVNVIYKQGFYRNDDLFNGRYTEYVLGFSILYGFYLLQKDRRWWLHLAIILALYIAAGWLCQYAIDELGREEFELAHSVVFGRIVWNYEVPVGKVKEILRYMIPLGLSFILVMRPLYHRLPKLAVCRTLLALMIPLSAWSYLGMTLVDTYATNCVRKQEDPFTEIARKIMVINPDKPIYYLCDYNDGRRAGLIQFMLPHSTVIVTDLSGVDLTEDAYYIMRRQIADEGIVRENCEQLVRKSGYVMSVGRSGSLYERWKLLYKDRENEPLLEYLLED